MIPETLSIGNVNLTKWCLLFTKSSSLIPDYYPTDLVNTKTITPSGSVHSARYIYVDASALSIYNHHYSPPLWGIVVVFTPVVSLYHEWCLNRRLHFFFSHV